MSPYFQCLARTLVEGDRGVDPNRGYGLEWGGPGTSSSPGHGNYAGPGPFTEPELEGFRRWLRDRQVAVLVTNHTSGRLLMRPPGTTLNGPTPDEATMKPIGDAMGAAAGYTSQYSYDLYDTTGLDQRLHLPRARRVPVHAGDRHRRLAPGVHDRASSPSTTAASSAARSSAGCARRSRSPATPPSTPASTRC